MGTALGILGALLIGKIALGTVVAGLTVPAWVDLGGGVVTLVQLDVKLLKALAAKQRSGGGALPGQRAGASAPARLCFQHPRVGVMWICVPQ